MKRICFAGLIALTVIAGCVARVDAPPASVAVQAGPPPAVGPAPPPTGPVSYEPDYYVWDGAEYVGVSGGQYVYWSGGAWLVAPPVIRGRFHGWERYHPAWRRNGIRYHRGHEPFR